MKRKRSNIIFLIILSAFLFSGCIHEYPHPVAGPRPGQGEDPTKVETLVEVFFDLQWQELIHKVEFETKARTGNPHRFIIELETESGEKACREEIYISDEEFSNGYLSHQLKTSLTAQDYRIGVWYDRDNGDGSFPFDSGSLDHIGLNFYDTFRHEALQCAYASDKLLLSDLEGSQKTLQVKKELHLSYPGARFEIVATDINQFISDHKEALNQGDVFTVHISLYEGAYTGFNLFANRLLREEKDVEFSGRLYLPFAEYDELKIAEGFVFCNSDSQVTARLILTNSALFQVSRTDYFEFPVKPGYTTILKGDFLTNPVEGIISIDNIWEGEIKIEI